VHVVVGDVLNADEPLVHRHDVRVKRRGGVILVARDLHDRADLAAELVARGEAPVGVGAPALDEVLGQAAVAVRVVAVAPAVAGAALCVRHVTPSSSLLGS
jgi:hypothetical protein